MAFIYDLLFASFAFIVVCFPFLSTSNVTVSPAFAYV